MDDVDCHSAVVIDQSRPIQELQTGKFQLLGHLQGKNDLKMVACRRLSPNEKFPVTDLSWERGLGMQEDIFRVGLIASVLGHMLSVPVIPGKNQPHRNIVYTETFRVNIAGTLCMLVESS